MMFVKVEEVRDRIKKYFHVCIDAGLKEIDVVDCAVELLNVIDTVPEVAEDPLPNCKTPHPSPLVTPSPQGEGYERNAWVSVKDALPECGERALVIVNGKNKNITFIDAVEMGTYFPESWLLDAYPDIDKPEVSYWMELPDGPEE